MKMETGTFSNSDLQEYIEKYFIPVKYTSGIDSEQFLRYGVSATPVFIVLDADGNEIYRKIGYFEPGILIEQLEKARKKLPVK